MTTSANTPAEGSLQVRIHRLDDQYKDRMMTTSANTPAEGSLQVRIHRLDDQYKDRMMTTSANTPAERSLQVSNTPTVCRPQVPTHRPNGPLQLAIHWRNDHHKCQYIGCMTTTSANTPAEATLQAVIHRPDDHCMSTTTPDECQGSQVR
jgi:hypothetical protein